MKEYLTSLGFKRQHSWWVGSKRIWAESDFHFEYVVNDQHIWEVGPFFSKPSWIEVNLSNPNVSTLGVFTYRLFKGPLETEMKAALEKVNFFELSQQQMPSWNHEEAWFIGLFTRYPGLIDRSQGL